MHVFRFACAVALLAVIGCATSPLRETSVLAMKANALPDDAGLPPAGTVWRLDEHDLHTLSPAPYVPPPAQPIPMPPRVSPRTPPPPVWFHPYWGWGVPYHGSSFGFSLRYGYPRHPYYPYHPYYRW